LAFILLSKEVQQEYCLKGRRNFMGFLAISGVCLTVLFGTVVYETRRLKREEEKTKSLLKSIRQTREDVQPA
jgi:hypothetical protein